MHRTKSGTGAPWTERGAAERDPIPRRPAGRACRALASAAIAASIAGMPLARPAATAFAAGGVALPFSAGERVRVIQGYNGGTHRGASRLGLDLVLAGGGTGGAPVLAPFAGRVVGARAPGAGNGCVTIENEERTFNVMLCHVLLDRPLKFGDAVVRGQPIGTVGKAGTLGNNGTPHVHLELYRLTGGRAAVPFSPPEGLALDGVPLPGTGRSNEHGGRDPILSTNGREAAPNEAATARAASAPKSPAASASPAPAPKRGAGDSGAPAVKSLALGAAVVADSGDCLNVRERPAADAKRLECLPDGTAVTLVDGPVTAGGHAWYRLQGRGWATSAYLAQPTSAPAAAGSAPRTATASAAATTGIAAAATATGRPGTVRGTDSCLNVRESPRLDAGRLACLAEGSPVAIAEGPVAGDGQSWYRLQGRGWAAAAYIRPAEAAR